MRRVTCSSFPTYKRRGRERWAACLRIAYSSRLRFVGTNETNKGGVGVKFGVCLYCDLRAEGVERCSTALPVARSCSLYIARYTVAD